MRFDEWYKIGMDRRWITEIVCDYHQGAPMTEHEVQERNAGEEVCVPIVRVIYGNELENYDY
jgi:hypothetical protein